MPENEVAVGAPETGWLYQPFESGARAGATVAVGEDDLDLAMKLRLQVA